MTNDLIILGVNSGNSLDAVDVAGFQVTLNDSKITDLRQVSFTSHPFPAELKDAALSLRETFKLNQGLLSEEEEPALRLFSVSYHQLVNETIAAAREELRQNGQDAQLIGFHGQTLGHYPPSIAGTDLNPYTIQVGNGGLLSDTQDLPVIADFRSDDVLNGGEGAPFAPMYQQFLAQVLQAKTPVFINAGNTSNLAVIDVAANKVAGWDCGPCNQFPDLLMRTEKQLSHDQDGTISASGKVQPELIKALWEQAVIRPDGQNALELNPPRSFDPFWYKLPTELTAAGSTEFADRLRTTVAFSAYCVAHSLALAVEKGYQPDLILLFAGGWKNQILTSELKAICSGQASYILPEHQELFRPLIALGIAEETRSSDTVGLPSNGMEPGIFAYAALQRARNLPFSLPSVTGCKTATICGALFTPQQKNLRLLDQDLRDERHRFKNPDLSRASLTNQGK